MRGNLSDGQRVALHLGPVIMVKQLSCGYRMGTVLWDRTLRTGHCILSKLIDHIFEELTRLWAERNDLKFQR